MVACLTGVLAFNLSAQSSLTIYLKNKNQQSLLVSSVKKIVFTKDNLEFKQSDGSESVYAFTAVAKIAFSTSTTGTDDILSGQEALSIYPNPVKDYIYFRNLSDNGAKITIFNLNGSVLLSTELNAVDSGINVSVLEKGFYLLKVNDKTFKFTKL
jgi:hypothetical protein